MTTHRTGSDTVVQVRGLTKTYGSRDVLRDVDLEIGAGETYALLGPNGAGKSTTIEILEGLRRHDSGEVRVLGEDPISAPRSWKSRLGFVSQSTGDFGPYTPRELLRHFATIYPNPRDVDEVLDLVGLTSQAGLRANKMSGGQQRRLDVALGIVGRPEMLFLDEPTTGFDPEARHQFWTMLRGLSAEGTAILLTTHYLDEAAQLADRVGVLTDGRIVAEAPPAELGGPEARTPLVRWVDDAGITQERRTTEPARLVAELVAASNGAEVPGLEIRRPELEDIYLELIAEREAADATATAATGSSDAARILAAAPHHPQHSEGAPA